MVYAYHYQVDILEGSHHRRQNNDSLYRHFLDDECFRQVFVGSETDSDHGRHHRLSWSNLLTFLLEIAVTATVVH